MHEWPRSWRVGTGAKRQSSGRSSNTALWIQEKNVNADRLANYAGVAPICHSSEGKGKNTQNKHLGNRDLYNVLYLLAMQQIQVNKEGTARNPLLRAYFEYKVSQGKTKIQAMICIMRRLVSIIYRMMKNQTPYQMPEVESPKEQMIS